MVTGAQARKRPLGEITVSGKNQVTLPVNGARALGLARGDRLIVWQEDDKLVLMRRPDSWTDYYAGKLSHVFGDDEETQRELEAERAAWDTDSPDE